MTPKDCIVWLLLLAMTVTGFAPLNAYHRRPLVTVERFLLNGFFGKEQESNICTKQLLAVQSLSKDVSKYQALVEYLHEWSELLGPGLTTPIQSSSTPTGVEILFTPRPGTGKYYQSAEEERQVEKEGQKKKKEEQEQQGGIQIVVLPDLTVQAQRFNYGEDAVIKEMSEETITSGLKEALAVWKKKQQS
jgi:hypothetical protein